VDPLFFCFKLHLCLFHPVSVLHRFWDIWHWRISWPWITHPANLCTICTSLKSTDPRLSFCCWWCMGRTMSPMTMSPSSIVQQKNLNSHH